MRAGSGVAPVVVGGLAGLFVGVGVDIAWLGWSGWGVFGGAVVGTLVGARLGRAGGS